MINNLNKRIKFLIFCSVFFVFFSFFASISFASTEVYFQNNLKEIKVGDTLQIDLKISTDKSVNVVDGTIIYDKDKIEIEKINKDNSIFTLWAKEPIFDNKIGELSFTAGVPGGFSGTGQALNITFRAKKSGDTSVGFKDIFSVYENNGLGTIINPWLKPLSLSIAQKSINYFIWLCILILLSIIIVVSIKFKNKNEK